jgi:hypothetical protein
MNNINNVNFKIFEDELGNLKQEFEVIVYYKNTDGKWNEHERFESGRNYYVLNGQLYYRCNNSLLPMNMDFNNESCGACYVIGEEANNVKITGNEILFVRNAAFDNYNICLTLHKQNYSNGHSFYSLQDNDGQFKLGYGSEKIEDLIKQIESEILIDSSIENEQYFKKNIQLQNNYYVIKRWREDIVNQMKLLLN